MSKDKTGFQRIVYSLDFIGNVFSKTAIVSLFQKLEKIKNTVFKKIMLKGKLFELLGKRSIFSGGQNGKRMLP